MTDDEISSQHVQTLASVPTRSSSLRPIVASYRGFVTAYCDILDGLDNGEASENLKLTILILLATRIKKAFAQEKPPPPPSTDDDNRALLFNESSFYRKLDEDAARGRVEELIQCAIAGNKKPNSIAIVNKPDTDAATDTIDHAIRNNTLQTLVNLLPRVPRDHRETIAAIWVQLVVANEATYLPHLEELNTLSTLVRLYSHMDVKQEPMCEVLPFNLILLLTGFDMSRTDWRQALAECPRDRLQELYNLNYEDAQLVKRLMANIDVLRMSMAAFVAHLRLVAIYERLLPREWLPAIAKCQLIVEMEAFICEYGNKTNNNALELAFISFVCAYFAHCLEAAHPLIETEDDIGGDGLFIVVVRLLEGPGHENAAHLLTTCARYIPSTRYHIATALTSDCLATRLRHSKRQVVDNTIALIYYLSRDERSCLHMAVPEIMGSILHQLDIFDTFERPVAAYILGYLKNVSALDVAIPYLRASSLLEFLICNLMGSIKYNDECYKAASFIMMCLGVDREALGYLVYNPFSRRETRPAGPPVAIKSDVLNLLPSLIDEDEEELETALDSIKRNIHVCS